VRLARWIDAAHVHRFGRRGVFAIGWDEGAMAQCVVLESVKRALDVAADELARAQGHAPMRTQVGHAADLAFVVAPQDELFAMRVTPTGLPGLTSFDSRMTYH
jgi:hypothetical protein